MTVIRKNNNNGGGSSGAVAALTMAVTMLALASAVYGGPTVEVLFGNFAVPSGPLLITVGSANVSVAALGTGSLTVPTGAPQSVVVQLDASTVVYNGSHAFPNTSNTWYGFVIGNVTIGAKNAATVLFRQASPATAPASGHTSVAVINAVPDLVSIDIALPGGASTPVAFGGALSGPVAAGLRNISYFNGTVSQPEWFLAGQVITCLLVETTPSSTVFVGPFVDYDFGTFSQMRFAHFAELPTPVIFFVNGAVVNVSALDKDAVANVYVPVRVGPAELGIGPVGSQSPAAQSSFNVTGGKNYTAFAAGFVGTPPNNSSAPFTFAVVEDDTTSPSFSYPSASQFRFVNLVADSGVELVTLTLTDDNGIVTSAPLLPFAGSAAFAEIDAGTYTLQVVRNGTALVSVAAAQLAQYVGVDLVASGSGASAFVLTSVFVYSAVRPPPSMGVRFVNAVPNLKDDVDLVINGTVFIGNSSYFAISKFHTYSTNSTAPVDVRAQLSNTPSTVLGQISQFQFVDLLNYTFVVSGLGGNASILPTSLNVRLDDLRTATGYAKLHYINVAPINDSVAVKLSKTNATGWPALPFNGHTNYSLVPGAENTVSLSGVAANKTLASSDYTFNNKTVYTIWAYGDAASGGVSFEVSQDYPPSSGKSGLSTLELGLIIGGAILFAVLLLAIIIFVIRSNRNDGYETIGG